MLVLGQRTRYDLPRKLRETSTMKMIALTLLLLTCLPARASADTWYNLVSYQCDAKNDLLLVQYKGAHNQDGENLVRGKPADSWEPWSLLVMKDSQFIGELKTVERDCLLSDGTYHVSIGPTPGNMNVGGRCGAFVSAWTEIAHGADTPRHFELEGDCLAIDQPVITEIAVHAGKPTPEISSVPKRDFYQ